MVGRVSLLKGIVVACSLSTDKQHMFADPEGVSCMCLYCRLDKELRTKMVSNDLCTIEMTILITLVTMTFFMSVGSPFYPQVTVTVGTHCQHQ